jgi:hypothetical protein
MQQHDEKESTERAYRRCASAEQSPPSLRTKPQGSLREGDSQRPSCSVLWSVVRVRVCVFEGRGNGGKVWEAKRRWCIFLRPSVENLSVRQGDDIHKGTGLSLSLSLSERGSGGGRVADDVAESQGVLAPSRPWGHPSTKQPTVCALFCVTTIPRRRAGRGCHRGSRASTENRARRRFASRCCASLCVHPPVVTHEPPQLFRSQQPNAKESYGVRDDEYQGSVDESREQQQQQQQQTEFERERNKE